MNFKLMITLFSLMGLFVGGSNPKQIVDNSKNNCPDPPVSPPKFEVKQEREFFEKLKILNITSSNNITTFHTKDYDFIFCDDNKTFITQVGNNQHETKTPDNYEEAMKELVDPPYKNIEWQQKNYQFRVILDPHPFPDFQVEPTKVVLELITPETQQSQKHTLYTLEQVKKKQAGIQLGVPKITATVINNNQIYWSISPEQGEGNGGIATIVNYDPQLDKINIIQPSELAKQQINDLKVSNKDTEKTIWLATQTSGEGNPYLPGMGLVSYNINNKSLQSYHPRNSDLVGIIPHKLAIEHDTLWVATGNGICQMKWQKIEQQNSWQCWKFKLQADIPSEGLEINPSLLNTNSTISLNTDGNQTSVDVLWWSSQDYESKKGRYEIVYDSGFSVTLKENGAMDWPERYNQEYQANSWEEIISWPGKDWVWNGNKFIRPFDGVFLNYFGGGPGGISTWKNPEKQRPEIYAMRGELELIKLSKNATTVKHYSGWVDDSLLEPYITIVTTKKPENRQPNPLKNLLIKK